MRQSTQRIAAGEDPDAVNADIGSSNRAERRALKKQKKKKKGGKRNVMGQVEGPCTRAIAEDVPCPDPRRAVGPAAGPIGIGVAHGVATDKGTRHRSGSASPSRRDDDAVDARPSRRRLGLRPSCLAAGRMPKCTTSRFGMDN